MQRQRIRDEAAQWVVRLSASSAPEDRAAFEVWRAQSLDHEIAYEREAAVWERLDRLSALRAPGQLPVMPLRRPLLRRWALVAAGLVAVIGLSVAPLMPSSVKAYATGVGEQQRIVLADGTTIDLNTDSRIEVRYAHNLRLVRLVRGEAIFHVADDERPFTLRTPSARLDASHADFSVRLTQAGMRVAVSSGAALASENGADQADHKTVAIGPDTQVVLASDGARVQKISTEDLERQQAWRHGAIELNGQTLSAAAAEFNRYNTRQIFIADSKAAGLHVGGYFRTTDANGFISAVTRTFPVKITSTSDDQIVLSTDE